MVATSILRCMAGGAWLLFVGLALGACASGGGMGSGGEGSTALEVQNNLIPPTSLTVYVIPDVGTRRLIGSVTPGSTTVLRFEPPSAGGQFQFMAQTTFGSEIVSNPVSFSRGASVRWDLSANLAIVTDG